MGDRDSNIIVLHQRFDTTPCWDQFEIDKG